MKKGLLKLLVFVGLCLVLWWCRTPLQTGRQSIEKLEIPAYTEASYKKHLVYEGNIKGTVADFVYEFLSAVCSCYKNFCCFKKIVE